MKINKSRLKQIIAEEIKNLLNEESAEYKSGAAVGRTICDLASKYSENEDEEARKSLEAKIEEVKKSGKTASFPKEYWTGMLDSLDCTEAGQVSALKDWIENKYMDYS